MESTFQSFRRHARTSAMMHLVSENCIKALKSIWRASDGRPARMRAAVGGWLQFPFRTSSRLILALLLSRWRCKGTKFCSKRIVTIWKFLRQLDGCKLGGKVSKEQKFSIAHKKNESNFGLIDETRSELSRKRSLAFFHPLPF